MAQFQSLSTAVTSISLYNNFSRPNVTVPYFDRRAREMQDLTGVDTVIFAPIVRRPDTSGWEKYAWENQDWIEQSIQLNGADISPGTIPRNMYKYGDDQNSSDLSVPIWQISPIPRNASFINLDLYSIPDF